MNRMAVQIFIVKIDQIDKPLQNIILPCKFNTNYSYVKKSTVKIQILCVLFWLPFSTYSVSSPFSFSKYFLVAFLAFPE